MALGITDPTLNSLQWIRENLFQSTMREIEMSSTGWEYDKKEIEILGKEVKEAGQNPSDLDKLEKVRDNFRKRFQSFQLKIVKFDFVISHISTVIHFLEQKAPETDTYWLEQAAPEFYEQVKKTEEVRQQRLNELSVEHEKMSKLKRFAKVFLEETVGSQFRAFNFKVEMASPLV